MKQRITIADYRLLVLFAVTMLLTLPAFASPPVDLVSRLHMVLIESMKKADTISQKERHQHLAPVLKQIFDFNIMVKTATGPA